MILFCPSIYLCLFLTSFRSFYEDECSIYGRTLVLVCVPYLSWTSRKQFPLLNGELSMLNDKNFLVTALRNLTVCVCTLNEEQNIAACIDSIRLSFMGSIIIVDGNSDDATVQIAKDRGCEVIVTPIRNLAHQRNLGVNSATTDYLAFFDADDRPSDSTISEMIHSLIYNNATAVMARSKSFENSTYWQRGMDFSVNIDGQESGFTNMIGQPSMFVRKDLVDIQHDETFTSYEDTFISRSLEIKKKKMYLSDAINYRLHDRYFADYCKKIRSYGAGDARFIKVFPERRFSTIYHLLINYPIIKSFKLIKAGKFYYVPFVVFMGLGRFYYLTKQYINDKLNLI